MKNKIFLTLFITLSLNLFASGANNPRAEIYDDIDRWRNIGLIDRLPPIRPYPVQYIISILDKIIEVGDIKDVKLAKKYREYYTNNSLDFVIEHNSYTSFEEYQTISGFGADANLYLNDKVTAALDINAYLLNGVKELCTPPNQNKGIDVLVDNMNIKALGMTWDMFQGLNISAGFGTDTMWFQTGLMPSSFGPLFSDSVVLNPNAKQAAHFSYTWIHDLFTASYLFLPIVATDNQGNNETDDKYLHVKSVDFKFTDFWEFQFYESTIYGGRGIKPIFFLPFSEFFYSAGQGETWDVNSLMGLSSRFQLPKDVSLTGTVYVDDLNAIEIAKLNLNTRMKLAAQFEAEWVPKKSFINSVRLNYTALTPYMYTHTTEAPKDDPTQDPENWDIRNHALKSYTNYENYTNGGVTMGPYGMEPNSDKIGLNIGANLPKDFKVRVNFELQRHGNSSKPEDRDGSMEEVKDSEGNVIYTPKDENGDGVNDNAIPTDGTIFDPGYGWTGGFQYKNSNPFLTQDVIETMFISEIVLDTPTFDIGKGGIKAQLGYAFVYIENHNLIEDNDFDSSYLKASVTYSF